MLGRARPDRCGMRGLTSDVDVDINCVYRSKKAMFLAAVSRVPISLFG